MKSETISRGVEELGFIEPYKLTAGEGKLRVVILARTSFQNYTLSSSKTFQIFTLLRVLVDDPCLLSLLSLPVTFVAYIFYLSVNG